MLMKYANSIPMPTGNLVVTDPCYLLEGIKNEVSKEKAYEILFAAQNARSNEASTRPLLGSLSHLICLNIQQNLTRDKTVPIYTHKSWVKNSLNRKRSKKIAFVTLLRNAPGEKVETEYVDEICIDSGVLLFIDAQHLVSAAYSGFGFDFRQLICDFSERKQCGLVFNRKGFLLNTPGDGTYPLWVGRDKDGNVSDISVDLYPDDEEDDVDGNE